MIREGGKLEGQSWREGIGLIASLFPIKTHTNSVCGTVENVLEDFLPERKTMSSSEEGGSVSLGQYPSFVL